MIDSETEKEKKEAKIQLIKFFRDVALRHLVTHPVTNVFFISQSFLMSFPDRNELCYSLNPFINRNDLNQGYLIPSSLNEAKQEFSSGIMS